MKRLYAYIIKSFIGPFVFTFFICIFVLLMQFLWRYLDDLVGKGLENEIIIELISYAAFSLVPLALPLAVLLASIMTFGNLGERLELLAMKASGVSLLKIMRPLIVLNLMITMMGFYLADQVIPITNAKFAALLWSVKEQRPEMIIKEGIFSNDIDGYSIKVNDRDPVSNALLDIMIYDHTEEKGNVSITVADSGYLNMSDNKQYMILTLFNGESYTDSNPGDRKAKKTNPFRRQKFKKQDFVISVKDFELKRADEKFFKAGYKMLKNHQLMTTVDSLQQKYNEREKLVITGIRYNELLDKEISDLYLPDSIAADSTFDVALAIPFDSLFAGLSNFQKTSVLNSAQRLAQQNQRLILQYETDLYTRMVWMNKHLVEWHKKYTLSLACLLFFFMGAPLGAIIRKGGFGMPVVISILLFISYYLVSVIVEKIAREGVWEIDMVLWFPSMIFLLIGAVLTHQAVSDSLLLNKETYNRFIKKINVLRFLKPKKNRKGDNEDSVSN
jgi:lipopolysaccharide export system permease protein